MGIICPPRLPQFGGEHNPKQRRVINIGKDHWAGSGDKASSRERTIHAKRRSRREGSIHTATPLRGLVSPEHRWDSRAGLAQERDFI